MRIELTTYALRVVDSSRVIVCVTIYRFRLATFQTPVARPTNTMTPPMGKVKIMNQGKVPKVLVPSFIASSIKIDATRVMSSGRNANISPPRTINDPRFL